MTAARFDVERARLEAAQGLPAECFEDFQRLTRSLVYGPDFQWVLVDAPVEALRNDVIARLDTVLRVAGLRVVRLPVGRAVPDVQALERRLVTAAKHGEVVHVLGARGWFDTASWDAFNVRRERLAADARARLVFWLDPQAIELASRSAPDLWAWRSGVYTFHVREPALAARVDAVVTPFAPRSYGPDDRTMAQRYRRVAEIRAWLQAHPGAPDDLRAGPVDELGRLLYSLGDYEAALQHWRTVELPLHRRRGADRDVAITMGMIADVLQTRGDMDEVLRIRREEELPVYDKLSDVRSRAVTMGKVADVLQARGELDEALRIRREEQLPVFESLGDLRERAVTMGGIADALQLRGELDEALRIRREEELPVYDTLGDLHSRAVALGRIADVLQVRGELDEALRIRREEQLPVYEKLGDIRSRAVTMGRIADVLQARGALGEALRIRREEELPVFEKLGDVRERAVTMGKIADVLQARGELDEALHIRREEELPVYEKLGDLHSRAATMGQIADLLQARGDLDEALRIRREEELPVFEKVGDIRACAITEWKIALADWEAGRRSDATARFHRAWKGLESMGVQEADSLRETMQALGIPPDSH